MSPPNSADLCIAAHSVDPERPRRAMDGLYLCHGHRDELAGHIKDLPHIHDELAGAKVGTGGVRGSGGGIAIDERVAVHRGRIDAVMASWCRVVVEDRGLTPPATDSVHATAPWLASHVDWCAAQPWADEMLLELRQLVRRAVGISDIPARRVRLEERCLVHTGGERCAGTITIVVRGDDWHATCGDCDEPQEVTGYLRGTGQVTSDGVIKLARVFGVPCSEDVVWQWRHRGRIKGRSDGQRVWYDLASVHEYLTRRTATRERMAG